jgi:putative hydrolase of the HAD superfamily
MPAFPVSSPLALTLDLDDTLWPVWPAIERAEHHLHGWLHQHAPATAQRFDPPALRALRNAVEAEHPHWRHDLSAIRRESIARALAMTGHDPQLAVPAFDVFFAARQRVEFFDDALPGLARLAARFPLYAVTNGNADLATVGVAQHFKGSLSSRELGIGKPDVRIFHLACERLGVLPAQVLHVGDDLHLDVHGARDAGLQALWLHRPDHPKGELPGGCGQAATLIELADMLGC